MFRPTEAPRLSLLLVAALCGAPLAAQEPAETFEERIEVRVVNLEVVVTDADGRRVSGLGAEDFAVRVDGREAPITHFSEILAGPGEPAVTSRDEPGASAPASHFLVFIDDHVALARNRDFVLARLRRELPVLGPRDSMAIVAYNGRRLEVLSDWTGSAEDLDHALAEAMLRPADGIRWVALARMPGFVANWIGNATRRSVLAAAASLRLLPPPAGRKALILVAGSWDPSELSRAEDFSPWCVTEPCFGNFVLTALTDSANLLGYSIYAVDVEGRDVQQSWSREKRLQGTLAAIADATGGLALYNTERRRMLSVASDDVRSYYSLGVTATDVAADQRHRIEVEVLQPGLEARNRQTFVAVSERREGELEVLTTLLRASEESPAFPAQFGAPDLDEPRYMTVPLSVFVPIDELVWLEEPEGYAARLEIRLASVDGRGNSSEVATHEVHLEEAEPPKAGSLEHVEFDLRLRRRRHTVAVQIRDLNGEAALSRVIELSPPER